MNTTLINLHVFKVFKVGRGSKDIQQGDYLYTSMSVCVCER